METCGKGQTPYLIRLKEKELFGIAGLWERWTAPTGEVIDSCTIVTTEANAAVAQLHDRMPVPYIESLYLKGIVNGKAGGIFDPEGKVTRGELSKMVVLAFGIDVEKVSSRPFQDVEPTALYAPYIAAVKKHGFITGYNGGVIFKPNADVTRADALKIILTSAKIDTSTSASDSVHLTDVPEDAWFSPYIATATLAGIVDGYPDGTFKPNNPITRAEVSEVIVNILHYMTR